MDIFWNHTSIKEMQSLLTATLSQVRGQVWKGVAPAHNIVGRPTLETNNLGAPVSQCILSDQGEILAKKKIWHLYSPTFAFLEDQIQSLWIYFSAQLFSGVAGTSMTTGQVFPPVGSTLQCTVEVQLYTIFNCSQGCH